jgi:hypothetical protein
VPLPTTLDRLDLALGIVGALGALVCLALAASTFRAALADLAVLYRGLGGPDLDRLEEALLVLASRAPDGELRAGALEDGSLLVLPPVSGQCLVLPSETPFRRLAESLYLVAQRLPMRIPHGPPGAPAEIREVTLYRLTQRGRRKAGEIPGEVLDGELSRRSYPGTGTSANSRPRPG